MLGQPNMKSSTDIKLPLGFILFGLIAFVIAQGILLYGYSFLESGQFRSPAIWSGAHFLLLGFAMMVAMGAMYQLVPVAFLTEIWSHKLGYIQLWITIIGITCFAILLGVAPQFAVYGAAVAIVGVLLFLFQMGCTILKQKQKNMMTYFVLAALTSLALTISAGLLLAWNLSAHAFSNHNQILSTHILFGLAGWFTLLIIGFSYKLVPMFSLSHGFSMKMAKKAFIAYICGLMLWTISVWIHHSVGQTIGWLLLLMGFFLFTLDILEILKKRIRKQLDKPLQFSLLAIGTALAVHTCAFLLSLFQVTDMMIWSWLIYVYVMAWIIFSILGYLYKIVPFLWWTHRFSDKIGKEKVPTMKEMVNEKRSVQLFILFVVSMIGILVAVWLQQVALLLLFQGLLFIGSVLYAASIIHVLRVKSS